MGAWSASSFGNDAALDFISGIGGTQDLARCFDALIAEKDWIDADLASQAIAAADVVAALLGRPGTDFPEDLAGDLESYEAPDSALVASAQTAVRHVRTNSELAELWAESDDPEWLSATEDLLLRLDLNAPYLPPKEETPAISNVPVGSTSAVCQFCGESIPKGEVVTLIVENDDDEDVWFSSTSYAHRHCIEQNFDPPHFNADGTIHSSVLIAIWRSIVGG